LIAFGFQGVIFIIKSRLKEKVKKHRAQSKERRAKSTERSGKSTVRGLGV
jgi:hypothetical protein